MGLRRRVAQAVLLLLCTLFASLLFETARRDFIDKPSGSGATEMWQSLGLEVVGALIAAGLIAFTGFVFGRVFERRKFLARYETAVSSFSRSLEEAIKKEAIDPIVKAKVIVSIRNSTRVQLSDLSKLLNSDIDTLERLLLEIDTARDSAREVSPPTSKRLDETLNVLQGTWPAKKPQIDVAVRRVLAELGLKEV
jgi:hypothetical protein